MHRILHRSYVLANAQALRHGEKAFTIAVDGEEVSFRARREVCYDEQESTDDQRKHCWG